MWFETVRIHFLSEFSVCCQNILLPWQRDVTTSITSTPISLYSPALGYFQSRGEVVTSVAMVAKFLDETNQNVT